jgi:hypothetical protein
VIKGGSRTAQHRTSGCQCTKRQTPCQPTKLTAYGLVKDHHRRCRLDFPQKICYPVFLRFLLRQPALSDSRCRYYREMKALFNTKIENFCLIFINTIRIMSYENKKIRSSIADLYPIAQNPAIKMAEECNIKKVLSAGVLALWDLPHEKRLDYIRTVSRGDTPQKQARQAQEAIKTIQELDTSFLNEDAADLFERLKAILGPDHGMDGIVIHPAKGRPPKPKSPPNEK